MKSFTTCALVAAAGVFSATSANAALVAHYELGEADAGAAAGNVGNDPTTATVGADLARTGDPTYSAVAGGAPGSTLAMTFDGDDFYHDETAAPAFDPLTQDLTLSAWVNTSGANPGGFSFVASLGSDGNAGLGILEVGGQWGIIHMGLASGFGGPAIVADTWTHLELRYTSADTTSRLFVDGVDTGISIVGTPSAPTDITIGANHLNAAPTFEGFFIGSIDEVTVDIVPEPGSLALLGLGGLMIARRRRG